MSSLPKAWNTKRKAALLVFGFALGWLLLISTFHYWLNVDRDTRIIIKMGHMPVIANLACPLLDKASQANTEFHFQAMRFSSFAEIGEALRNGQIQVGFMIAPLSIVLRQQGADVKIPYIGNRHESTFVVRNELQVSTAGDLVGKTVAVPLRFSGHNLCLLQILEKENLTGKVKIVEMNPPDMAAAMVTGALDAYFVGEPFAAKSVKNGNARVFKYVEELWPGFICNLMVVRNDLIQSHPEIVKTLVTGAARSGLWASRNPSEAAKIAAAFWNQSAELIEYAISTPPGRVDFGSFVPKENEIQRFADLMVHFKLIPTNDISGLVYDKFAHEADVSGITDFTSILP